MSRPLHRHKRKRREKSERLFAYFAVLAQTKPELLDVELDKRLRSWLEEIQFRGRQLGRRYGAQVATTGIFDLLEDIEQLMASHPEIKRFVGPNTLEVLRHESAKSFATAVDPRLYKLARR